MINITRCILATLSAVLLNKTDYTLPRSHRNNYYDNLFHIIISQTLPLGSLDLFAVCQDRTSLLLVTSNTSKDKEIEEVRGRLGHIHNLTEVVFAIKSNMTLYACY